MNRNQVLPQIQLSSDPQALKRVDFCAPQSYKGAGFLSISDLPRVAKEVSAVIPGDGFEWNVETHFEESPGSDPHQIMVLGLNGRLHLVCQRCLQGCAVDLAEKRRFILLATEEEADSYPVEDEEQEPLVASQQFNLLDTIEDEILLSIPLIPKHPESFCQPQILGVGGGGDDEPLVERENPFNVLKNMKKNS